MARLATRLLLVLALVVQGWVAIQLTRYDQARRAGARAFREWLAADALASYELALARRPADSVAWRNVGDVALYMVDYPEQLESPPDIEALIERGWEAYVGAVRRCPVEAWSWAGIAEVALNRAERIDAVRGVDLGTVVERGEGVVEADRAMALSAASIGVELSPSAHYALDVLAAVYESMGDLERAERLYVESARMMPAPSYHVWGDGSPMTQALYRSVLDALREGLQHAPSFERSRLHLEIGKFARTQGDYETALAQLQSARDSARNRNERYNTAWELTTTLERIDRYEEALDSLRVARENARDPGSLSRKQGVLERRVERYGDACATLRQAVRREPDDPRLRLEAAAACEQAGDDRLAAQLLEEGFVLPIENMALAHALVELHRRHGRESLADYLVEAWIREFPKEGELQGWRTP